MSRTPTILVVHNSVLRKIKLRQCWSWFNGIQTSLPSGNPEALLGGASRSCQDSQEEQIRMPTVERHLVHIRLQVQDRTRGPDTREHPEDPGQMLGTDNRASLCGNVTLGSQNAFLPSVHTLPSSSLCPALGMKMGVGGQKTERDEVQWKDHRVSQGCKPVPSPPHKAN